MTRRWSLRTRFVTAAALCLLPLVGISLYLLNTSLDHSQDQLVDTDFAISDVVSQGLASTLDENQLVLAELAKDPRVQSMSAAQAQEALNEVRAARPSLNGLFLLSPDNTIVTSVGGVDPAALLPQFSETTAKALNAGEPAISNKLVLNNGDIGVITLAQPVLADPGQSVQGQPVGALGAFLNVDRLQRSFAPAAGYASGDTTIAIVADNQIIATSSGPDEVNTVLSPGLMTGPVPLALEGKRVHETYDDGNGDQRLAVVAPVAHPGVNWGVVVTTPSPMTYGPNQDLLRVGLFALGAAILLTLILAVIFGELTARPLRQLAHQAAAITRGDFSQPIQPVGRGEVALVSDELRDMADKLTTQVRDTEAARAEIELQAERLRELLRRTVRLQEDERRRIAGDIHDAVSPLITGALYRARAIQLTANGNGNGDHPTDDQPDEDLHAVSELLEKAMSELHDVIFALRPPDLDDLGVVAAIDRYVAQINRTGLPCHLEVIGEAQRLSPEARLGVYRIVQEALHNALRHAHADDAVVRMEWLDDRLRVTIRDDGSGFDPESAANPNSLGLLSMRERAAAIGATLEIASRPGAGTAIILERSLADDLVTDHGTETVIESSPAEEEFAAIVTPAPAEEPVALSQERQVRSA